MIKNVCVIVLFLWFLMATSCLETVTAGNKSKDALEWQELPDIPQAVGGPFVGVSNHALIVAGGSHFPVSLFEGGKKVFEDKIYVLEAGEGNLWKTGFKLDFPLAHGASVTTEDSIICIGGRDEQKCYTTVFRLIWDPQNKKIELHNLPDLPQPCSYSGATVAGNIVYVAGGVDCSTSKLGMKNFWALDLSKKGSELKWQQLEPWPEGPGRTEPVILAQDNGQNTCIYVIGGCEPLEVPEGQIAGCRRCLTDAYRYDPGIKDPNKRWTRLTDVPKSVAAAPAIAYGQSHILVFGGADDKLDHLFWELGKSGTHPGFYRKIRAYHTITDSWLEIGEMPTGLVTTQAVWWQGNVVIPAGEIRPGVRSPKVLQAKPLPIEASFGMVNYSVLIGYFVILLIMGFYFSRREKSLKDYFLGGRRIPEWAAGISIFGTSLSALTFMALPAKVFATNCTYYLAQLTILLVAPIVIYFYLPFFRRLNITTAYEYLEKRFNLLIRLSSSTIFILFQLGRMGIIVCLPAITLSTITGIDVRLSILAMGVLCTIYTTLGGIEAVIWTDVLQVVILLGGLLLSLFIIISKIEGGLFEVFNTGWISGKFHTFNWSWDYTITAVWVVFFGSIFSNLMGFTADQAIIQRYLTTSDEKQAAKAIWISGLMAPLASAGFFLLGITLFVFYKSYPQLLEPGLNTDAIFPFFIVNNLPMGVSGLIIAALFAAAMSSIDSSMNSVTTALINDFYKSFRTNVSEHKLLKLARLLTIILGILATGTALLLASYPIKSLFDLFFRVAGLFTGGLGGLFVLGIFTRAANGRGAFIGLITSAIVLFIVQSRTNMHFFLYSGTGLITCVIVGYLASILIPEKDRNLHGLTIFTKNVL